MEIYLIRHGETDSNKHGQVQGAELDTPLNKEGKEQAAKTGDYLHNYRGDFDLILSSPLKRAKKTAEIIAKKIGYHNKIVVKDDLIEHYKGKLSGLRKGIDPEFDQINGELKRRLSEIIDPIERELREIEITDSVLEEFGTESAESLHERARKVIRYMESLKKKKIIIVSHSGMLSTIIKEMFGIPGGSKLTGGGNCYICYCTYDGGDRYRMIMPPSVEHLKIKEQREDL